MYLFVFAKAGNPTEVLVLAGDKARFESGDQTWAHMLNHGIPTTAGDVSWH